MEGRDVGADVLPDADLKIYLTADEKVRAKRRFDERYTKDKNLTFDEVLRDLKERDYADIHRKVAPLKQAKDAIKIDNSNMDLEQTAQKIMEIVKNKWQKLDFDAKFVIK